MTRLDHAFIKIYADRGATSPAPPGPHRSGTGEDAPGNWTPRETADVTAGASVDNVSEAPQATAPRSEDLLPPDKITRTPQGAESVPGAAEAVGGAERATPALVPAESVSGRKNGLETVAVSEGAGEPATLHRLDPGPPSGSTAWRAEDQPVHPPHMRLPTAEARKGAGGAPDASALQNEATGNELGGETFQPTLQVDHFTWPTVCCRLGEAAADELDRLADALVELMARGKRVVAIGGCRSGEGATTVLLCAGRRLAELGLNLIMADAHLADPQLACRLGLLPESGWEDVVAGRLPLVEVVIESAIDRLAVLPVRQTPAGANGGNQDEARLVESIRTLAAHYDLVLLDPGPLEELGVAGASLARGIGSRLDAIVLVHRHGVTPPEDLDEVRRSLAETEIVQAGVVENFVRD